MTKERDTKEQLLFTSSKLFQKQGYHATGLSQIIKESGCPKGSLYYHFPNGKEQLAVEAIERATKMAQEEMSKVLVQENDALKAIDKLLEVNESFELDMEYDGVPVSLLALETSHMNENLRLACLEACVVLLDEIANKLIESGWPKQAADEAAQFIFFVVEGSLILAVTSLSKEPMKLARRQIMEYLNMKLKGLD